LLIRSDCDMTTQFDIGLNLTIRGLDAYLTATRRPTRPPPADDGSHHVLARRPHGMSSDHDDLG
jgi:hypothetical protein